MTKTLTQLRMHARPLVTDMWAWYPFDLALAERFEFEAKYDEDPVRLWEKDGDFIRLPRECCPVGQVDERSDGVKVRFRRRPNPRPNQVQVFNDTVDFLKAGHSGIVKAYTGFGKTVLGMYAAHAIGRKTLIVTTKDDIYQQWIFAARMFLGLEPWEIGEIRGSKCELIGDPGPKLCVALVQSLSKREKYPPDVKELFDDFGLVIFDEVHRLGAEQFQRAASMFRAKLRLGLSADGKRGDGKELCFLAHIGPVRVETKVEEMIPKVIRVYTEWVAPRVPQRRDGEALYDDDGNAKLGHIPHQAGRTRHIEKLLAKDDARSHLIGEYIKAFYDKGRNIVVFSTLHDHLVALARAAKAQGVPKADMGFYIGAVSKKEKEKRGEQLRKRVVFTTFGMMGEGTDADWLDTAFICMPIAKPKQPVGRVRRKREGKPTPLVIDFTDADLPLFDAYSAARLKWYNEIRAEVIEA